MNKIGIVVIAAGVVVGGFIFFTSQKRLANNQLAVQQEIIPEQQSSATAAGYKGDPLAGKASLYLDFKKADYEKALADGKIILLDFYANWCPICRAEAPELKAGFDSLTTDKVVGFRVNYNDSDTDEDEKKLAKDFGITYQHTKVILKNGKEVLRTLEQWDRKELVKQINSIN